MKLKISKKVVIAIIFIFLMTGSTLTYIFLQVFAPATQEMELPESNIIDYELTPEQESYLLAYGKTIFRFTYNLTCTECLNQKALLESLTNQFSDQLILQEIKGGSSSLTITSRYGEENLKSITQDSVIDSMCRLMVSQPIGCIRRGL
jgi:hypothetical protein